MPNNILIGLGAAVALIIAVVIMWLSIANAHLKAELATAESNNSTCHIVNDNFKTEVEKQNAAVKALQTEAAARALQSAEAEKAAAATAAHYTRAAAALMKRKAAGDECHAAKGLIDGYVGQK